MKLLKALSVVSLLSIGALFSAEAKADAGCLQVSEDQYDGYRQVTFYNSCDGSWRVWTIMDDNTWAMVDSEGNHRTSTNF